MNAPLQSAIEKSISNATGEHFSIQRTQASSGGCIHDSRIISDGSQSYFIKINALSSAPMFASEAAGLAALESAQCIRTPQVVAHGNGGASAFLLLEALELTGSRRAGDWAMLGASLAKLHRKTHTQFGFQTDNFIGATPQYNQWRDDWVDFFRDQRLVPQFRLAESKGFHFKSATLLIEKTEQLLGRHHPEPSLLHGDLWSGNIGFLRDGTPVIFDPAVYYGDRETDLAFSKLFGDFPASFYAAYQDEFPLQDGFEQRKNLYNLYHILNHLNLFGGSYAMQAEQMLGKLLSNS